MKALSTLLVLALGLAVVPKLIGADEPKAKPGQPAGEGAARGTTRRVGRSGAIRMCGLRFVRRFEMRFAMRRATRILKIGRR